MDLIYCRFSNNGSIKIKGKRFIYTYDFGYNWEHEKMLEWAEKDTDGRKFDPEYFYKNEVNRALKKIK